ncbi:cupin domain-containing protein [Cyanobium sp. CH-040]|uniref:cupin domain-containing protein n=1 Tax=Cyanobium sp. CH-040 TaxID=2823708 RepID=UPI0020CBFFBE|nr:cupin domain-containing protein [Cyanobium sp. CH-040]MCP9926996.1 cupin domain-containing protein [Cyanobium sp. CH-040]
MALSRRIELAPVSHNRAGATLFSEPLPSDETLIAEIGTDTSGTLFCHRRQTDQLRVLRGAFDLLVLEDRRLRRITLREDEPTWVRIPPGVPHGAINRGTTPAVVVNAVIRHGPSDPRDYRPRPLPGALARQWEALLAG